uniref:EOG090X0A55 n=1 Tax=Lynceus sp. MCZ IZ 141354 TaxID=1930659 RepID=A0A9N6WSY8_9CRUS|nr:EOG090X0A55 [Lynceus sp. MCZ IZ 141354]
MEPSKNADVKKSLECFLLQNILDADLSVIDDIVLNYIVSILEELGGDASFEEVFDVDAFSEMLSAYFPQFADIPQETVCQWMFDLVAQRNTTESYVKPHQITDIIFIPPQPLVCKSNQQSENVDSVDSKIIRRSPRVSECSELSSDGADTYSYSSSFGCENERDVDVQMLLEMFPSICHLEVSHCLCVANGCVDQAAQLILHRLESGDCITQNNVFSHKTKSPRDDSTLKKKIVERYSFVDQEDDQKEHRPPPVKMEPKKLVRYLDNKVVTVKGERFTEIKDEKDDKEDVKKTYVSLKPARQYRFH